MSVVNNPDIKRIESMLDLVLAAMAETDGRSRNSLLERATTDDIVYWSRMATAYSLSEMSEIIGSFLVSYGEAEIRRVDDIQLFRDVGRSAWYLRSLGENNGYQSGELYFEFNDDGRLRELVMFKDPPHYEPFGGGPKAYVDAWNAETKDECLSILDGRWTRDGRWVELKFDKSGRIGRINGVFSFTGKGIWLCCPTWWMCRRVCSLLAGCWTLDS